MTVNEFIHPILNNPSPVRLDDSPQTIPDWDSLAQINLIAAIEEAVGAELSTDEVLSLTSVAKVVEICRTHGVELTLE